MTSCLYECLCEAELEKYYPHFVAVGLQNTEELARITMKDYTKLGVHNMEDQKRLFKLIQIIQSVQEEEADEASRNQQPLQPGCIYFLPQAARAGPRRQLKFDAFFEENDGMVTPSELELLNLPDCCANKPKDGLLEGPKYVLPPGSQYCTSIGRELLNAGACAHDDLDLKALFSLNNVPPHVGENESPIIHTVTHGSGYNYGVPHSYIRPNSTEKEGPWTETDKIRVCVRKRPLGAREERRGEVNVVSVADKETVLIHEKKEAVDLTQYILQHVFYFDEVFSEVFSNQDVYMKTAYPLIHHIFNGGNATCFAYGQTGAGKTYTMIGTQQKPGLYALAAKDIFQQLESSQTRKDLVIYISFYEIYCGQLYDLLNGRKRLFAREDGKRIVQIVGLREVQVNSVDLLLEVIIKGSRERSTGATGVNSDSSRSHAIIQIQIKDAANRMFGRISFIDLAGSERAADARESDKQTKIEGAEINQSLLALKECIRALDQEHAHTPFRQSKLTQVLKDSFIGNSKTCMIANISPSHVATEHTLNTLRYADRVKELKKGMKFSTAVASRGRSVGSSSPKRIQTPTSGHLGEKSSPKKVKLGLNPSSPASGKLKAFPSVFHPSNVPLSSTPKLVNKNNPFKGNHNQAWLNHTTPVKGLLRAGQTGKKKNEDPTLRAGKDLAMKGIVSELAAASQSSERSQGNNLICDEQPLKGQRVQVVQPVQKQIISRDGFSFGEKHSNFSGNGAESRTPLLRQSCEPWTNTLPYQKEREQHLRFYHQQFQKPPILHQKLKYQHLERFLAQYRPQEINLKHDNGLKDPTSPQYEDGTQFEELDDSDFSEDSFSYLSNQRRKERQDTKNESNQHSFFLHQRQPDTEVGQKVKNEQNLLFKYEAQAQQHSICENLYTGDSTFPRMKESIPEDDCNKNQSDWNTKDNLTIYDSSRSNNTAEKPYPSQGDVTYNWKNILETSHNLKNKCPVHPNINPSLESHNLSLSNILDSGVAKPKENTSIPFGSGEENIEDSWTSSERNEQKENVRSETGHHAPLNTSSDSVSGLMAPLSMSLLDSEKTATFQDVSLNEIQNPVHLIELLNNVRVSYAGKACDVESQENITISADSMSKFVEQILRYDGASKLQSSPQTEKGHFSLVYDKSKSLDSPVCLLPSSTHQGSVNEKSVLPKSIESYMNNDNALSFRTDKQKNYESSTQYDADTEDSAVGICLLSVLEKCPNFAGKEMALTQEVQELGVTASLIGGENGRVGLSNACSSSSLSVLRSTSNMQCKNDPKESNGLELIFGSSQELNDFEDSFKLSFHDGEMGILKHKLIPSILTHKSLIQEEQDSGSLDKGINYSAIQSTSKILASTSSQTSVSEIPNWHEGTLEKVQELVIQAHREQLDEMTALSKKEESLLSQMSQSDFKEYVTKLDEIMVLKSKCIQSMRAQLQLYLAYRKPELSAERTSAS
ncbi:kinesin-like protein KIF24 [Rhinatrema bivittatum]|uniref:kinesin-like protein KIF24 n=1 Tax=Rhinatrema bivittatum TaxID=194408 RepID=UPI00112C958A|nr:kinesin-like protein KIF24 [Rhinatrema bivittatum]